MNADLPQFMLDLWERFQTKVNLSGAPPYQLKELRAVYLGGAQTLVSLPYRAGVLFADLMAELEAYRRLVLTRTGDHLLDLTLITEPRYLSRVWEGLALTDPLPQLLAIKQNLFFSGARDLFDALVEDKIDRQALDAWLVRSQEDDAKEGELSC